MVEAQLAGGKPFATVLANVGIAGKNITPVEFDGLAGKTVVTGEPDHPRHLDHTRNGSHPVIISLTKIAGPVLTHFPPAFEIVGRELSITRVNDLGHFFA